MNITVLKTIDFFLTSAERWFMYQLEEDQENALHYLNIWSDYIEDIYLYLQTYAYDRKCFPAYKYANTKILLEFIEFIDGNGFCIDFNAGIYEVKLKSNT